ncbi:MAG: AgmX/PglI C-terminal domain-containing protein, partial [Myxococcaceae bacterium]
PKVAVAVTPPKKVEPADPEREVKPPPSNAPTREQLALLYGDPQKADKGPRVRKDTEVKQTDTSTGGLAAEAVAKVVGQYQPAFQQCIEQELRKNPGFRGGKIDIVTTVASSGIVKRAEIDRKDIDLSDLGGCLKGRAKRMQFPSFAGDEETEVHIPLILSATL